MIVYDLGSFLFCEDVLSLCVCMKTSISLDSSERGQTSDVLDVCDLEKAQSDFLSPFWAIQNSQAISIANIFYLDSSVSSCLWLSQAPKKPSTSRQSLRLQAGSHGHPGPLRAAREGETMCWQNALESNNGLGVRKKSDEQMKKQCYSKNIRVLSCFFAMSYQLLYFSSSHWAVEVG